jgi:hypothetical protein
MENRRGNRFLCGDHAIDSKYTETATTDISETFGNHSPHIEEFAQKAKDDYREALKSVELDHSYCSRAPDQEKMTASNDEHEYESDDAPIKSQNADTTIIQIHPGEGQADRFEVLMRGSACAFNFALRLVMQHGLEFMTQSNTPSITSLHRVVHCKKTTET